MMYRCANNSLWGYCKGKPTDVKTMEPTPAGIPVIPTATCTKDWKQCKHYQKVSDRTQLLASVGCSKPTSWAAETLDLPWATPCPPSFMKENALSWVGFIRVWTCMKGVRLARNSRRKAHTRRELMINNQPSFLESSLLGTPTNLGQPL